MMEERELDQFYGSQEWFSHWTGKLIYTEGIRYLAERAGAYWLLDQIASYQTYLAGDEMLREIQFWTLTASGSRGKLTCIADRDIPPAIVVDIPYTDFPLREVQVWVERGCGMVGGRLVESMVVMLPNER